jgi:uncharacterized membrane-anchored protein YhcB (DUF1043 family)
MSPIVLIGAGALILLVGVGLGYVLSGVKGQRDAAKADEVRQELDRYRQEVSEHFGKTAEHFQAIGAEYRKLYEHMASGEASLCEPGRPVAFTPPELLAEVAESADPQPPRDYEIADSDETASELPEIVANESVSVGEPEAVEPTDQELVDTEATEELLAEHELAAEDPETEKTLH